MRRSSLYIILALLILGLGAGGIWLFTPKTASSPRPKTPLQTQLPAMADGPVVLPDGFDWAKVSGDDLQTLWDHFGEKKTGSAFEMDTEVVSGRTIVADVYEGKPGEFVCSNVTPTIKTLPDGSMKVEVAISSTAVNLSGAQRELFSDFRKTRTLGSGSMATLVQMTEGGNYTINVVTDIKKNGERVRVRLSGSYNSGASSPD